MTKQEWCPTQGGTYLAYIPEWLDKDIWKEIPTHEDRRNGVPQPRYNGGINSTIGLMGYEQASAIAWTWAASAAREGVHLKIRLQAYDVLYDIKARKTDIVDPPDLVQTID